MGINGYRRIVGLTAALFLCGTTAWAGLENPVSGAIKSGVGLLSGWVCDAERLEVSFDGAPRQFVPYGSERIDTAYAPDGTEICGDTNNGFGLLINYNNLGDGSHSVTLYVDGQEAETRTFTVVTLGSPFQRGLHIEDSGHYVTIELSNGNKVEVVWDEATQNFAIADYFTLDDLLGTWKFRWFPVRGAAIISTYHFTSIEEQQGYRLLRGQSTAGAQVLGGLVLRHIEFAAPPPPDSLTLPTYLPISDYQFFTVEVVQTQQGPQCLFTLFDIIIAEKIPPGAPAEVVTGTYAFAAATGSRCADEVPRSDQFLYMDGDRVE